MKIKFMYHQISNIDLLYSNQTNGDLSTFFGDSITETIYKGKEYCEKVLDNTISKFPFFSGVQYEGSQERVAREIFSATTNEGKYTFIFTIDTYETIQARLQVSINFEPNQAQTSSLEQQYNRNLETIKLALKDTLKKDWNQCTWLIDTQSELLCTNLYPCIFKIENKLRAFVSKVLTHHLGINWLNRAGLEKYHDSVEKMKTYFNQRVPEFDGINAIFLSMTLETLFEILFDGKVYDENLVLTNAELMTLKKILGSSKDKKSSNIEKYIFDRRKLEVEIWNGLFAQYFSDADAFRSNVTQFIKDRNHIAHNKLLSFSAYKQICSELSSFEEMLDRASDAFARRDESEEMLSTWEIVNEQEQYDQSYEEQYWRSRISEETGVDILDFDEIYEKFCETMDLVYESVKDRYHFDPCFEVSCYNTPSDAGITKVFTVSCNGSPENQIEISTHISIDDDMDGDSCLEIICKVDTEEVIKTSVFYHNGSGHEGEEGLAIADSDSDYDDSKIEEFVEELFNYIENELNSNIKTLEALKYTSVKEGGDYPVADFPCEECGKFGVSITEEFLPIGQCCFCGYENEVRICELCKNVYDSTTGHEHLCPMCSPKDDD